MSSSSMSVDSSKAQRNKVEQCVKDWWKALQLVIVQCVFAGCPAHCAGSGGAAASLLLLLALQLFVGHLKKLSMGRWSLTT